MVRSRASLHLEIIALRHQLAVVHRSRRPRLRLTSADRALWAWLSQVWDGWRSAVIGSIRRECLDHVIVANKAGLQRVLTDYLAYSTEEIEAFRDWRKTNGLSPVAVNHDLKLLRKMFNWSIRKRYLAVTPFKLGTEPAIALERGIPRNWRVRARGGRGEAAKGRQPAPSRHHHRNARHRLPARGNAVAAMAGCEPPTARDHDSPSQGENAHGEDHPDLHATGCDVGDEACASGMERNTPRRRMSSEMTPGSG
jgi:hypothetical protein